VIQTKRHGECRFITKDYPRVDNDLLMLAASFKRSPSAPELFCLDLIQSVFVKKKGWQLHYLSHLSEPARSTKFNLPKRRCVMESLSQRLSITQVKTLCERLLSLFIFVAAIFLFATPYKNISETSMKLSLNSCSTSDIWT
jgi:hypothetical protein